MCAGTIRPPKGPNKAHANFGHKFSLFKGLWKALLSTYFSRLTSSHTCWVYDEQHNLKSRPSLVTHSSKSNSAHIILK